MAFNLLMNSVEKGEQADGFGGYISVLLVHSVKQFQDGLMKACPSIYSDYKGKDGWNTYDLIAFEYLAWSHYFISKGYTVADMHPEKWKEIYSYCLAMSAGFSREMLKQHVGTRLSDDLLIHRVCYYGSDPVNEAVKCFVRSIVRGEVEKEGDLSLGEGLTLTPVILAYLAAFSNSYLTNVRDSSIEMFLNKLWVDPKTGKQRDVV